MSIRNASIQGMDIHPRTACRSSALWLLVGLGLLAGCSESDSKPEEDLCRGVVCSPTVCQAEGECDPLSGECVYTWQRDGTRCDDGDACTYGDQCQKGQCVVGGGQVVCRPLDDCHTAGECDPESGCSHPVKADDSPCGDAKACTTNDRCVAGECIGDAVVCDAIDDCHLAGECNPGTGQCSMPSMPDGSTCGTQGGNLCEKNECLAGVCQSRPVDCEALDECHLKGACDPDTGQCSHPPKADGSECEEGDLCTENDTCQAGVCSPGTEVVCQALDDCHGAGVCDPVSGCSNPLAPDDSSCDDGDACTQLDQCLQGSCIGSDLVVCEPLDSCHRSGVCDPATGQCSHPPIEDGVLCNDDDACTTDSTCQVGVCTGGAVVVCQALDDCHLPGECDQDSGCSNPWAPAGTSCDDENLCTRVDSCQAGVCVGEDPIDCPALNDCHESGMCNPYTGTCIDVIKADGSHCNDGNLCTLVGECQTGTCTPIQEVVCDLDCLGPDQVCDISTGRCTGTPVETGLACDDRNPCTGVGQCQNGACQPGTSLTCDPIPGGCYAAGQCDPATAECTNPQDYPGMHCDEELCFLDVTADMGIELYQNTMGQIDSYVGAGSAVLDFDGDGWSDILLAGEQGLSLFRNLQGMAFEDVTLYSRLPYPTPKGVVISAVTGDYDNDGHVDIFLMTKTGSRLFKNAGDSTFSDVSDAAGVTDSSWCVSGAFGDFDHDGYLDLYVGCYIQSENYPNHTPFANKLYLNDQNGGFSDETEAYSVGGAGTTLAVLWSDFDGDGWVDLFVCNDFGDSVEGNRVYKNMGAVSPDPEDWFVDETIQAGANLDIRCQGLAAGDYDRNGELDYYVSTLGANSLLQNTAGSFTDVGDAISQLETDACESSELISSWGAGFVDFNNDGWLDLYVANGFNPDPNAEANSENSPNAALVHEGAALTFADVSRSSQAGDSRWSRGVAFFDFDNDGDVDVLQANANGSPVLLRNDNPDLNGWIQLTLQGRLSNRDALGSKVVMTSLSGTQLQELGRYGFESTSSRRLHFGLGSDSEATSLEITWPSGVSQTVLHTESNTHLMKVEAYLSVEITNPTTIVADSGDSLPVALSLQNQFTGGLDANYSVDIQINGESYPGPTGTHAVGAGATDTLNLVLSLPDGESGSAEIVVSVWDTLGAEDQDGIEGSVSPP